MLYGLIEFIELILIIPIILNILQMTQEIIIPRGQNVGYSILNAIGNTKQHVKSIDLRRDLKNKCIIATILLVWIQ